MLTHHRQPESGGSPDPTHRVWAAGDHPWHRQHSHLHLSALGAWGPPGLQGDWCEHASGAGWLHLPLAMACPLWGTGRGPWGPSLS